MGDVGEHRQSILAIRRGKTVACRRKLQGRNKRLFQKQESLQENLLSKFESSENENTWSYDRGNICCNRCTKNIWIFANCSVKRMTKMT